MNTIAFVLVILALVFAVLGVILSQPKLDAIAVICLAIAMALNTYPLLNK